MASALNGCAWRKVPVDDVGDFAPAFVGEDELSSLLGTMDVEALIQTDKLRDWAVRNMDLHGVNSFRRHIDGAKVSDPALVWSRRRGKVAEFIVCFQCIINLHSASVRTDASSGIAL